MGASNFWLRKSHIHKSIECSGTTKSKTNQIGSKLRMKLWLVKLYRDTVIAKSRLSNLAKMFLLHVYYGRLYYYYEVCL